MKKIRKIELATIIIIALFSIMHVISYKQTTAFASLTLIVGIVAFIITQSNAKKEGVADSCKPKGILESLKLIPVFVLMVMPIVMNVVCYIVALKFVPEFIELLKGRTEFLAIDQLIILIPQLMISALGEEMAWRAVFQKQSAKLLPFVPALIVTSILFAVCHISQGNMFVVLYDITFVFTNSILYGIIFNKTNNVFASAISHFCANLFGIIVIMQI